VPRRATGSRRARPRRTILWGLLFAILDAGEATEPDEAKIGPEPADAFLDIRSRLVASAKGEMIEAASNSR